MRRILLIDNYDSFTYNLVQQVRENSDHSLTVLRNDELEVEDARGFDAFILSPGPGLPKDSGVLCELIDRYAKSKPMYGVCLGMQAMAEVFGGRLINVDRPLHGMSTEIELADERMFSGIGRRCSVGRYHSWAVDPEALPPGFIITAQDDQGIPMAMAHEELPLFAVQFHPESILTENGDEMIRFFLDFIEERRLVNNEPQGRNNQ